MKKYIISITIFLAVTALYLQADVQPNASAAVQTAEKSAPGLGDADFPAPTPGDRHNEKVTAINSGKFDLVLIGDSITQTVGEGGDPEWDSLNQVWKRHYASRRAINLGYSGYRTENILWNLKNGELDFTQSPKLIVLLIGTNNTDDQNYPRVHTAEEVFAGTKAIVELIRQRHPQTKILLRRPFPCGAVGDQTSYHRRYNRSRKALEELRRAGYLSSRLADGKYVFWSDVNYVFLRPDGTINTDLMPDLIHPNAAGAEAAAQATEPTLAELMGDKPIVDSKPDTTIPVFADGWMTRHREALDAKAANPQIIFIGDSITHHISGIPAPTGPYLSHRGDKMWETICTKNRPGLNLGFGGDRTQNVLWRLDHGELDGISPKYVVLMIGTNNVLSGNDSPDQIVEGVRACVLRIRAKTPKAQLILMGILPCHNPAANPKRVLAAKVNESLKKLAAEAKTPFLDLTPQFLDADGNIPLTLMEDGVHPTPAGYKIWSDALSLLLN